MKNLGFTHVFNIIKIWWFTLIYYFLTTVLMKISAAKLDNSAIPPKLARGRRSQDLGFGGCDNTFIQLV
ncbi:hypothetical protein Hdeb2414_s0018g00533691 [Helianthus debilis subsp. tardiflorus]